MRQVILIPDETGGYMVEVPSLPGCYSQGETEEEALANIREAIALHIESLLEDGEEVPEDVGRASEGRLMPKLPVVSADECIRVWYKIGYVIDRQRGSHITLKRDDPPGRVTVPNHKELKPGMLRRIIRDAGLTVAD